MLEETFWSGDALFNTRSRLTRVIGSVEGGLATVALRSERDSDMCDAEFLTGSEMMEEVTEGMAREMASLRAVLRGVGADLIRPIAIVGG